MSYNFEPVESISSKTLPGVKFSVKKMSEAERSQFRLMQADAQGRISDLVDEVSQITATPPEAQNSKRAAAIRREIDMILYNEVNHTWVKWGLESIDALNIKGIPATVDDIAEGRCPSEFYEEVLDTIKKFAQMLDSEIKNFLSPSISGTPVDSATNDTSAENASKPATSAPETAASTSQTE